MTTPRPVAGLLLTASVLLTTAACGAEASFLIEDGEEPGEPLSYLMGLVYFLVIPLVIMALLAIPYVLSARKRSRYRPSEGWEHQPVWFAGPDDPESAVQAAPRDQRGRGGASATW